MNVGLSVKVDVNYFNYRTEAGSVHGRISVRHYTDAAGKSKIYGSGFLRQTTVLGTRADTLVAKDWPGHNVLDIPDWTLQKNIKWLDSATRRGDDIYLATDPSQARSGSVFQQELRYLEFKGYVQEGQHMVRE